MAWACCQDARPPHAKDVPVWVAPTDPTAGRTSKEMEGCRRDLQAICIPEEEWYKTALSRERWSTTYQGLQNDPSQQEHAEQTQQPHQVKCLTCNRCFCRESNKKRHKCLSERAKPIQEQRGAVHCTVCQRWFRSNGGLKVHKCRSV